MTNLHDLNQNKSILIKGKLIDLSQPKIMGVLNANEDSFFKSSRFDNSQACLKIENLIEDGANIIDIGAVSSRPGSIAVEENIELQRIKDIVDTIYQNKYYEKVDSSHYILCWDTVFNFPWLK